MARQTFRGQLALRFLDAAPANLAAPTQAELTVAAGIADILGVSGADGEGLMSMDGWEISPSSIDVPDAASLNTASIPGEVTLGDASLTYYMDDTTQTIQDLFTADFGLPRWLGILPFGLGIGNYSTIVGVRVQKHSPDYQVGNSAATFTTSFSKSSQTEGAQVT